MTRREIGVWILCLIAALTAIRCGKKAASPPEVPPNILLITIDTVRPDYLSCYGSKNPTPTIDSIAKQGMLFENAFSQVPLTFPSHTTILTGLFPVHHGVHNNGLEIFSAKEKLITSVLRRKGYKTGAVVSSFVLDRKFGLADGFDLYDDRMERRPGIHTNFEVERPGSEVTSAGIRILQSFGNNRWFLWLHYYDPHTPYAPPAPFEGYAGEIAFADQQIGILLNWLRLQNKDKNLAIAIAGDHGESLGEHGEATHGFFVYNSTISIPLILSYPGGPSGARIKEIAATADLTPTLLEIAGAKDALKTDGESLLQLASGNRRQKDVYFESRYPELLGWNSLQGLMRQNWKLISTTRSELYDWQNDTAEKKNLFTQREDISIKMKADLVRYSDADKQNSNQPDSETIEKLKSLGYIGSTSISGKKGNADPKDKIQVWAEYETILALQESGKKAEALEKLEILVNSENENNFLLTSFGSQLRLNGEVEKSLGYFQQAIKNDPADAGAYQEMALAFKDLRDYKEAIRAQEAALAIAPERSDAHSLMGLLLVETAQFAEAEKQFSFVLKADPNNAVAWNNYGNALREMNRPAEAEAAYKEAIRLSPNYAYPLNGLATILIRQKKTEEALPYLEKAIQLDPKFVEVYLNMGIAYHSLGELDKARTLYRTFLKISPSWMKSERENASLLLNSIG